MKSKKGRKICFCLATSLAAALTAHYLSGERRPSVQPPLFSTSKILQKESQDKKAEMVTAKDPLDKIKSLKALGARLDQAYIEMGYGKKLFEVNKKPTKRRAIKSPKGYELIEIVHQNGQKTYLPNFERYDPSQGKFLSKEFL